VLASLLILCLVMDCLVMDCLVMDLMPDSTGVRGLQVRSSPECRPQPSGRLRST